MWKSYKGMDGIGSGIGMGVDNVVSSLSYPEENSPVGRRVPRGRRNQLPNGTASSGIFAEIPPHALSQHFWHKPFPVVILYALQLG